MLNSAALPRISLPTTNLAEMWETLSNSTQILGYVYADRTLARQKLFETLSKCDIMPFESKAVQDYKNKKRRQYNAFKMPWNRMHWWSTPLTHYDAPVPMDVLNKAMQIKENLPRGWSAMTLELGVQYFAQKPKETLYGDPFLTAKLYTDEIFYLAVWDEPTFKP